MSDKETLAEHIESKFNHDTQDMIQYDYLITQLEEIKALLSVIAERLNS